MALDFDFYQIPSLEWAFEDQSWRNNPIKKGDLVRVKPEFAGRIAKKFNQCVFFYFGDEISRIHAMSVSTCIAVNKSWGIQTFGAQFPPYFLEHATIDEEVKRLRSVLSNIERPDLLNIEISDPYAGTGSFTPTYRATPSRIETSSYILDDIEICRAMIISLEERLDKKINYDRIAKESDEIWRAESRREYIKKLERRYGRDYVYHEILLVGGVMDKRFI